MADLLMPEEKALAAPPGGKGAASARTCIVMNARSGKRKDGDAIRELEMLASRLDPVELRRVPHGLHLAAEVERAVGEGFGTIVAAGGDGTVCAVASHLAGSGITLGVLPLGTFNYFARGLDLPDTLEGAVEVLAAGRTASVQVGEVNGRVFLNNASLGIYPAILKRRERIYHRWGRSQLAAYWSVILSLIRFRSPLRLRVTVDGQVMRVKTPLVFVANNPYQLELFGLEGADCVRSGRFALLLAPDCGRLELVLYALKLMFGRMVPQRDVEVLCGSEIVVEDRLRRRLVARDGERELMTGPFRFHVRRDALQVLVPAGPG